MPNLFVVIAKAAVRLDFNIAVANARGAKETYEAVVTIIRRAVASVAVSKTTGHAIIPANCALLLIAPTLAQASRES
jgi:hypothetical protein